MKIGKYKIGRYRAIIKKVYEDGSIDYETSFSDIQDLCLSVNALNRCLGTLVGIGTDNPRIFSTFSIIRGNEEIKKELGDVQNEKESKS